MASMVAENFANRLSMATLVIAGMFFIYEGSVLIELHRENPKKISNKVVVAGTLTIVLGVISIAFAVLHLFFEKFMSK